MRSSSIWGVKHSKNMVEERLGCVRLNQTDDDKVEQNVRLVNSNFKLESLDVVQRFRGENLQTSQSCVNVFRATHVIMLLVKRILRT